MYTKDKIIDYLNDKNIPYEQIDHPRACSQWKNWKILVYLIQSGMRKCVCHDRKKRNYFLIMSWEINVLICNRFAIILAPRVLSFAKDDDLDALLGVEPGSVSPFAILNDKEQRVQYVWIKNFLR